MIRITSFMLCIIVFSYIITSSGCLMPGSPHHYRYTPLQKNISSHKKGFHIISVKDSIDISSTLEVISYPQGSTGFEARIRIINHTSKTINLYSNSISVEIDKTVTNLNRQHQVEFVKPSDTIILVYERHTRKKDLRWREKSIAQDTIILNISLENIYKGNGLWRHKPWNNIETTTPKN